MCHWRFCAEKGQHRDSMVISRWKCKCLFCAQTRSSAASLSRCISNTCNLSIYIYIYTVRSIFETQESWPVLRNSFSVWTIGRYITCFSSISNFTLGNHTWHNFSFSFGDSDSMIEIVWNKICRIQFLTMFSCWVRDYTIKCSQRLLPGHFQCTIIGRAGAWKFSTQHGCLEQFRRSWKISRQDRQNVIWPVTSEKHKLYKYRTYVLLYDIIVHIESSENIS